MKRPRRATPTAETFMQSIHSVKCPHCHTTLKGGISQCVDRLFCYNCKEVIILDWQAVKGASDGEGS